VASVGPVFMFGNRRTMPQAVIEPSADVLGSAMSIPSLGVMAATRGKGGVQITEVASGGVAELAGLHATDVINMVDSRPVNSALELATTLSNIAPETKTRIGYMFRSTALGYFNKEVIVTPAQNR
jgi:S1-C subfamily serine protease